MKNFSKFRDIKTVGDIKSKFNSFSQLNKQNELNYIQNPNLAVKTKKEMKKALNSFYANHLPILREATYYYTGVDCRKSKKSDMIELLLDYLYDATENAIMANQINLYNNSVAVASGAKEITIEEQIQKEAFENALVEFVENQEDEIEAPGEN